MYMRKPQITQTLVLVLKKEVIPQQCIPQGCIWTIVLPTDFSVDYPVPFCSLRVVVFYFFIFLFFKILYCYLITLVCAFSPHPSTSLQLNPPPSPTSMLPLDFVHVSFIVVSVIPSPHCPLPTPPWLLLDCSKLQFLWLYFVCFFLLLIMFQLKVRSYGICPSPSGLFHLA